MVLKAATGTGEGGGAGRRGVRVCSIHTWKRARLMQGTACPSYDDGGRAPWLWGRGSPPSCGGTTFLGVVPGCVA